MGNVLDLETWKRERHAAAAVPERERPDRHTAILTREGRDRVHTLTLPDGTTRELWIARDGSARVLVTGAGHAVSARHIDAGDMALILDYLRDM